MLARGKTDLVYKATRDVEYHYNCEKCGHHVHNVKTKLLHSAHLTHNYGNRFSFTLDQNPKDVEKTRKQALSRLSELSAFLESMIKDSSQLQFAPEYSLVLHHYNEVFATANSCINCKSPQTWYIAAQPPIKKTWRALKYALLFAFIGIALWGIANAIINLPHFNFAIVLPPIPIISTHLNDWAIILLSLALLGSFTGLISAAIRNYSRRCFIEKAPTRNNPTVEWGEPTLELVGAPIEPEGEYGLEESDEPDYRRVIGGRERGEIADTGYRHMYGLKHDNICIVSKRNNENDGDSRAFEEEFDGIPMPTMINQGLSERDFQDYMLQLMDALAFMHNQTPSISHNAVTPNNILVGKGKLLKLIGFDMATVGDSPKGDIAMLGDFMNSMKGRYIKRYSEIIDKCSDGYNSIEEMREDFLPLLTTSYAKIVAAVVVLLFVIVLIFRRVL